MTSDPRERLERSAESTASGETLANVEWYFGDLLETVSSEYPVARHEVVATLAALEADARDHESLVAGRGETVDDAHLPGRVVRLPRQVWSVFEATSERSREELRAARDVHRRMGVALTGGDPDPSAPFFVFAAEAPV